MSWVFSFFLVQKKGNYHRKDIKIYNPSKTRDECPQVVPEFDHRLYHLPVPIKLHNSGLKKKYPQLARALLVVSTKFHLATPFVSDLFAKFKLQLNLFWKNCCWSSSRKYPCTKINHHVKQQFERKKRML